MRNLLYIGGGFAAGWALGKLLFGGGTIRANAPGGGGKGKKEPAIEELVSAQLFEKPLEPVQRVSAAKPEFAKASTLWSTIEPDQFLLMQGEFPIGVIVRDKKGSFSGYIGNKKLMVAEGAKRANAIGKVYAANMLLRYLSTQRDYSDVTVRSSLHYAKVYTVQAWRPKLVNANDIAEALGIPLPLIIEAGQKLAETKWVFGVSGKVRTAPEIRQAKLVIPGMPPAFGDPALVERQKKEKAKAKHRKRRGRKPKIEHKPRILVSKTDVDALRKGPALTKEEKKALPKAKTVTRYSFALYGPDGSVGMFQAGSKEARALLLGDWTEAEQERLQKRLEKREREAEKAKEEELKTLRQAAQTGLTTPQEYWTSREEAVRKLLTAPEEEPSDAFFEDIRLEGLDWLSRQRDQQYKARKVDTLTKGIEKLRARLADATKRKEAAEEAGDAQRMMQAVARQMELRSRLDEMLKKLDQAQKKLHEE